MQNGKKLIFQKLRAKEARDNKAMANAVLSVMMQQKYGSSAMSKESALRAQNTIEKQAFMGALLKALGSARSAVGAVPGALRTYGRNLSGSAARSARETSELFPFSKSMPMPEMASEATKLELARDNARALTGLLGLDAGIVGGAGYLAHREFNKESGVLSSALKALGSARSAVGAVPGALKTYGKRMMGDSTLKPLQQRLDLMSDMGKDLLHNIPNPKNVAVNELRYNPNPAGNPTQAVMDARRMRNTGNAAHTQLLRDQNNALRAIVKERASINMARDLTTGGTAVGAFGAAGLGVHHGMNKESGALGKTAALMALKSGFDDNKKDKRPPKAKDLVNMDSTGGVLADHFNSAMWGGERAGRTQAMADAMGEDTTFGVRHPLTQSLGYGSLGALLGGAAGAAAGYGVGSLDTSEDSPALGGLVGGAIGGLSGLMGGVTQAGHVRRNEMKRINHFYDQDAEKGTLNPKMPKFSLLSALLFPDRGPHRVGQLEAVRAMQGGPSVRDQRGIRDAMYAARYIPNVGLPLQLLHGYGQNIRTQLATEGDSEEQKNPERRPKRSKAAAYKSAVYPPSVATQNWNARVAAHDRAMAAKQKGTVKEITPNSETSSDAASFLPRPMRPMPKPMTRPLPVRKSVSAIQSGSETSPDAASFLQKSSASAQLGKAAALAIRFKLAGEMGEVSQAGNAVANSPNSRPGLNTGSMRGGVLTGVNGQAQTLSPRQQESVDAATQMGNDFTGMNPGAGGAGRGGPRMKPLDIAGGDGRGGPRMPPLDIAGGDGQTGMFGRSTHGGFPRMPPLDIAGGDGRGGPRMQPSSGGLYAPVDPMPQPMRRVPALPPGFFNGLNRLYHAKLPSGPITSNSPDGKLRTQPQSVPFKMPTLPSGPTSSPDFPAE